MGEMITKGKELYNKHEMRNDEKVEIIIKGNGNDKGK